MGGTRMRVQLGKNNLRDNIILSRVFWNMMLIDKINFTCNIYIYMVENNISQTNLNDMIDM